jgi:hypothetical protein
MCDGAYGYKNGGPSQRNVCLYFTGCREAPLVEIAGSKGFSATQRHKKNRGCNTAPSSRIAKYLLLLQSLLQLLGELSVLVAPILEVLQESYFRFDYPPERYVHQNRV